jgi:FKBP12-rapamycin complex-associated protein
MASLVDIVKSNIQPLAKDITDMCRDLWSNQVLHLPIVTLIEALSKVLDSAFKPHLPTALPLMLSVSETPSEKNTDVEIKIFKTFLTFGNNVEEYMHLLLPVLLGAIERVDAPTLLKNSALYAISGLSRRVNLSDYASRIIHPLIRVIPNATPEVRESIEHTIRSLVFQLGSDFAVFVPMVKRVR